MLLPGELYDGSQPSTAGGTGRAVIAGRASISQHNDQYAIRCRALKDHLLLIDPGGGANVDCWLRGEKERKTHYIS